MSDNVLKLPRLHPAQVKLKSEGKRFNVGSCGRRFGKTVLGVDLLLDPSGGAMGALSGYPVAWFAPSYKYLDQVYRSVRGLLWGIVKDKDDQSKRLTLTTGGELEFWTLKDADAGRSRAYGRVVVDEAAMVAELGKFWIENIRPTLVDYGGDAWIFSTPKGLNWFYDAWLRGQSGEGVDEDWMSWKMPTWENPFVKDEEIEEMRRSMPERVFKQEVEAEFISDSAGVFRGVGDSVWTLEGEKREFQEERIDGHSYVAGVDWGRVNDFTVITVMDATLGEVAWVERFTGVGYDLQVEHLRRVIGDWGIQTAVVEENAAGMPLVERLVEMDMPVLPFSMQGNSKGPLIESLVLAIERGKLGLVDYGIMLRELESYELDRLPSGRWRYGAPSGKHDDCVVSLALAWHAIDNQPVIAI